LILDGSVVKFPTGHAGKKFWGPLYIFKFALVGKKQQQVGKQNEGGITGTKEQFNLKIINN
jgi:hypothetical protein